MQVSKFVVLGLTLVKIFDFLTSREVLIINNIMS